MLVIDGDGTPSTDCFAVVLVGSEEASVEDVLLEELRSMSELWETLMALRGTENTLLADVVVTFDEPDWLRDEVVDKCDTVFVAVATEGMEREAIMEEDCDTVVCNADAVGWGVEEVVVITSFSTIVLPTRGFGATVGGRDRNKEAGWPDTE